MKERIDKVMVERGIVNTRSQASMLIGQGDVECNGTIVTKTGLKISDDDEVTIIERKLYVSRGGYKLEKALEYFKVNVKGFICADVGASTGGFTQVLIQNGAAKVYCVDVGHDQLAVELKQLPNVVNLEGTHIKDAELPEKVDLAVVDLSFISIKLVIEDILNLIKKDGHVIVLIKPQFEAGKERIGKNGLIKDESLREVILNEVLDYFKSLNLLVSEVINSPIVGNKSGNTEYLCVLKKN